MFVSCVDYAPKPRGYMRFEPPPPRYVPLPITSLPYSFSVSDRISIELPEDGQTGWLNLVYDEFQAKVYCSYLPVTKQKLPELEEENLKLIERVSAIVNASAYQNPDVNVYGVFFELGGHVASPMQFYLTDSVSRFFRGALYYDRMPNADSVNMITDYLRDDLVELITSFSWQD